MRAAMIKCCYGSVLAENTIVNTATFVKILGTGDTDVQRALQTIDAYNTPSEEASYPRGVENIADSTLSFDTATQTLTMTPTGANFVIFEAGTGTVVKHTFAVAQSVAIAVPAAGAWWFYFDGGVLQASQVIPYGFRTTLVALVYLDVALATIAVLDERHGINMPWQTHEYLHTTIGTRFENGFGITRVTSGNTGALDTDAQVIVTGGAIWDEDIHVPITRAAAPLARFEQELGDTPATPGEIPVYYRLGNDPNNWRKLAAIAAPLHNRAAPERPAYNSEAAGVWALTEISANSRYAIYWVCATNNLGNVDGAGTLCEPVFAIMGQGDYDLSTAQDASFADLQLGTFFANELKPLYKVIFRCSNGYANTYHAYVYEIDDLRNTAPLPGTAFVATDHQSLSGRTVVGAHPASAIVVDSAAFVGNLDIDDDTVQKVATKVDGLVLGSSVPESATIFVMKNGNDATGARGDRTKPYLTIAAALVPAQSGDLVLVGPGTFIEAGLTIPDVTKFHLKGSGIGITTIQFSAGRLIRNTNSALNVLTLEHFTLDRGVGLGVLIDGTAHVGGYFSAGDEDYLVVSYVEDVSASPLAWDLGWSLVRCANVRFENCRFMTDCGLVKIYNYVRADVKGCFFNGTAYADYKAGLWFDNPTSPGICIVEDTLLMGAWLGLLDNTQFSINSGCVALSSFIRISPESGVGDVDGNVSGKYPESTIEVSVSLNVRAGVTLDGVHDADVVDVEGLGVGVVSVSIRNSSIGTLLVSSDDTTVTPVEVTGCQSCLPIVTIQGFGADAGGSFNVRLYNCTVLTPTVIGLHRLYTYGGAINIPAFSFAGSGTLEHFESDFLTSQVYPIV